MFTAFSQTGYIFVKRRAIPEILSDEFNRSAWNEWCRWKRFGLPHGADGWMRERALWVACMEVIDEEYAAAQRIKIQRRRD